MLLLRLKLWLKIDMSKCQRVGLSVCLPECRYNRTAGVMSAAGAAGGYCADGQT